MAGLMRCPLIAPARAAGLAGQRRGAYSSVAQNRQYESSKSDAAGATFLKNKFKLTRAEIKGRRLWEVKASAREVMESGRSMIGEMRAMQNGGWDVGPMTFTSAISVFASFGLSKWAHRLYLEMIERGMQPTRATLSALLWGYSENGEIRGMQLVWEEMKRHNIVPDFVIYNVLLMGLIQAGHRDVVFRAFELMQKEEGMVPTVEIYNTLISASETVEEGWGVVNRMKADGVSPDSFSFVYLLRLAARLGDVRGAEDTLHQIQSHRVTPNASHYTILLVAYRVNGDYEGCCRVWERMKDAGVKPNAGTLTELLKAQEAEEIKALREEGKEEQARLHEMHLAGYSGACLRESVDESDSEVFL